MGPRWEKKRALSLAGEGGSAASVLFMGVWSVVRKGFNQTERKKIDLDRVDHGAIHPVWGKLPLSSTGYNWPACVCGFKSAESDALEVDAKISVRLHALLRAMRDSNLRRRQKIGAPFHHSVPDPPRSMSRSTTIVSRKYSNKLIVACMITTCSVFHATSSHQRTRVGGSYKYPPV